MTGDSLPTTGQSTHEDLTMVAEMGFNVVSELPVVAHARYVIFQTHLPAGRWPLVAIPRRLFAAILERVRRLRRREPAPA